MDCAPGRTVSGQVVCSGSHRCRKLAATGEIVGTFTQDLDNFFVWIGSSAMIQLRIDISGMLYVCRVGRLAWQGRWQQRLSPQCSSPPVEPVTIQRSATQRCARRPARLPQVPPVDPLAIRRRRVFRLLSPPSRQPAGQPRRRIRLTSTYNRPRPQVRCLLHSFIRMRTRWQRRRTPSIRKPSNIRTTRA